VIWLERRDVEAFHDAQISEFGGLAGLRDPGALESALARPLNLKAYGKPSLTGLAAAYGFGICRNHPFADGNKRTALVATFTSLELNGREVVAREEDAVVTFLALASGTLAQSELAAWLKANSRPARKRTR
jgi:death-on-curing protein